MDTISPAFDDSFGRAEKLQLPRVTVTARWAAAIVMVVLLGSVAAWRLAICVSSVLACTR